jgi:hypothetical protein
MTRRPREQFTSLVEKVNGQGVFNHKEFQMAKKKAVKKQSPSQGKLMKVSKVSEPKHLTPSLNDLVNALDVALHKDGLEAVIERLDFELGIHAMELDDKKQRPGSLTTYELIQSLEKKAKAKKKKKK